MPKGSYAHEGRLKIERSRRIAHLAEIAEAQDRLSDEIATAVEEFLGDEFLAEIAEAQDRLSDEIARAVDEFLSEAEAAIRLMRRRSPKSLPGNER